MTMSKLSLTPLRCTVIGYMITWLALAMLMLFNPPWKATSLWRVNRTQIGMGSSEWVVIWYLGVKHSTSTRPNNVLKSVFPKTDHSVLQTVRPWSCIPGADTDFLHQGLPQAPDGVSHHWHLKHHRVCWTLWPYRTWTCCKALSCSRHHSKLASLYVSCCSGQSSIHRCGMC